MATDLEQVIEQYQQALGAFIKGDAEPVKRLFSRRDNVTLANPFGPPAVGPNQVEAALNRAASQLREGEALRFESISEFATADLAYVLHFERCRMKIAGALEASPVSLRVTTIFGRDDGKWTIVHRQADPITGPRPPESIVER
ncbi:MAG TPA: nuclear transport factor 2 family protein [Candidatus Eisenbacteria bacterium]|nr:nuclear transport factor 2 family protein [Candidatus Eisenbacteria bacterium]